MSNTTNAIDLDETHLESSTMEGDDFQQKAASFLMYKIGKLSVCVAIKMISNSNTPRPVLFVQTKVFSRSWWANKE